MSEVVRQIAPILIEVFFFQGVYLLFPESSPWRRPTAVGLIVTAVITAVLIYGPFRSAPAISLPSPLLFIVVALAGSALGAGLHRYRDMALMTRNALALADRLDDFAQICRARLGHPYSLPLGEFDVKERALHGQYLDTFGDEIRRVHRALTAHNEVFGDLLGSMLGSLPVRSVKVPELATWVAKTLRLEATTLQRERPSFGWFDRRVLVTFCIYLGLASAVWLALFLASSSRC